MGAINLGSKLGKNLFINPSMDLWQRGTAFVGVINGDYTVDRYQYTKLGTMVHDINRSTDVPTALESKFRNMYSAFLNVTTLDAAIAVTDFSSLVQVVEGYNLRKIAGKNVVLSFWVKASKVGTYCISFKNTGSTRSLVKEYTINVANTWEKKTVRIKHDVTGTWDYENGVGLQVHWVQAVGTNLQTTPDTWQNGNFLGTSNQVNNTDAVNNEFRLTQVQLVEGIDEIPFEDLVRNIQNEISLAQRYFYKSYGVDVVPGTATNYDGTELTAGIISSGFTGLFVHRFPIEMRVTPVHTLYNPFSGAIGFTDWQRWDNGQNSSQSALKISNKQFSHRVESASNSSTYIKHGTFDAEL